MLFCLQKLSDSAMSVRVGHSNFLKPAVHCSYYSGVSAVNTAFIDHF